jgi:imidazolonepropionase
MPGGPQRGEDLGRLGILADGAVAVGDGQILDVGETPRLQAAYRADHQLDASGCVVLPGFVDPHTHAVWAGARAGEFEMRVGGASYMEIMAAGGGIMATVRDTRAASLEGIMAQSRPRVWAMLEHGTTTAEVKTGYGLETQAELRLLEAIVALDQEGPIDLAPTFLGAHAIPAEFEGQSGAYTRLVCEEMLPRVREWWLERRAGEELPFVDVFCEEGAFDLDQSRRILTRAKELGFPLKIHADEFEGLGGTGLAVELGATSADHLVKTPAEEIQALGKSDTVAVALPCTPFGLAERDYTPAQAILEAGGILALATDLNPGPAWCESMQFAIALACRYMGLTPAQALAAATINAAAAIGRAGQIGSLEPGKQADLLILDAEEYRHLGYRFGTNLVSTVVKRGEIVFERHKGGPS